MSFDDIDTPASEDELNGLPADEVIEPNETDPVEPESADSETPEAPAVEAKETERNPVIPRARFDEVNTKLHAEREENERLRAELAARTTPPAQSVSVDIAELEQQAFDAVMEGDREKAVALRAKIYTELESRAEERATARISNELIERDARTSLNSVAAKAYESYPFLDVSSDDANGKAIEDVIEWRDFYTMKGDSVPVALQKAVNKVGPMYSAEQAPSAELHKDGRKQAALARNAVDAAAQPPAPVAGIGNRAAPPKPKVESQQDWEKLSDADRAQMLA